MTITRRRLLEGATALTAAALTGGFAALTQVGFPARPAAKVAAMPDVLVLHDGGSAGLAFARQVRMSTRGSHVADRAVSVLTLEGFSQAGALLESASVKALVVLLNDAETLVMEALLQSRGAGVPMRRRHGRQVLLDVRL